MKGAGTPASRIYFWIMVALGAATCGVAGYHLFTRTTAYQWLILAGLTIVTGSITIKLPGVDSKVSLSDTLICINLVLFGPSAGAITAALDGISGSLRCKTSSRRFEFMLFNTAAMALSACLGGLAFASLTGGPMYYREPVTPLGSLLPALVLLALVYYFANSSFVALIVALERKLNVFRVWRGEYLFAIVNYFAAASVAGLLAQAQRSVTVLMVLGVLAAVAAIYVSLRSYANKAGRALQSQETANR